VDMRHNSAPTGLLDWTDSALIATYFSIRLKLPGEVPHAVWVLNPVRLNKIVCKTDSVMLSNEPQAAGYLPRVSSRGTPARVADRYGSDSCLAKAGRRKKPLYHPWEDQNGLITVAASHPGVLFRISIERKSIRRVLQDLRTCDVSETTIFPDPEGLSRELLREWQS